MLNWYPRTREEIVRDSIDKQRKVLIALREMEMPDEQINFCMDVLQQCEDAQLMLSGYMNDESGIDAGCCTYH